MIDKTMYLIERSSTIAGHKSAKTTARTKCIWSNQ